MNTTPSTQKRKRMPWVRIRLTLPANHLDGAMTYGRSETIALGLCHLTINGVGNRQPPLRIRAIHCQYGYPVVELRLPWLG
jgi:hypothetical protein